jgi:hypothetical protein
MGAHIGTMPYKVFQQLFQHPLTDKGLQGFLKDWEKARDVLGNIVEPAARVPPDREAIQPKVVRYRADVGRVVNHRTARARCGTPVPWSV